MGPTNELRVFISSTFRDLGEEREFLVKKVFPEIRARCRERGVVFTEIDLRWGLTEEEGALGRVIRTCLEEVDRCRPCTVWRTRSRSIDSRASGASIWLRKTSSRRLKRLKG